MKTFHYSSVTLNELEEIFNIEKNQDRAVFNEWLNQNYEISDTENNFLEQLINKHAVHINNYTELELISKFIAPILNYIDFENKDQHIRDWYEVPLKYETELFSFNGRCDYVIAKGYDKPMYPYFFIQEFKQASSTYPEYQLLAEMIMATLLNNSYHIKGAFIVSSLWVFMILEKINYNQYRYYLSKKYDAIELDDLKQIYALLQNIKKQLITP